MQQVILGLLILHGPLSLYGVQRHFQQGISLFYSASFGSIQRALKQLAENDLVTASPSPGTGRASKPYAVTDAGRRAWREWMLSPLGGGDAETVMLARVFFVGLLDDPAERGAVLQAIRSRVSEDLAELDGVAATLDAMDVPEEFADVAAFQRATLDYGVRSHRLALAWCDELAARSGA
jgi:DNA-binding PadR family transcriptional regulator